MKKIVTLLCVWLLSLPSYALELSPMTRTPYTGDLDTLADTHVLRVLVAADLGFYYIDNGKPTGIVAELLYHFEVYSQKKNSALKIQAIPVQRDELLITLERGYGDMAIANLTITDQRLERIDFSDPIITGVEEWLITRDKSKDITQISQLSDRDIWVRESSSYYESLQKINEQLKKDNLSPSKIRFIDESLQDYEVIEMIKQGYINTTVLDSHKAYLWESAVTGLKAHTKLPLRSEGKVGWAIRKDSPKLKQLIDGFIKESKKGTLLGNVIYNKYITRTTWLKSALNPKELDKLGQLSTLFKKYSDEYDFDALLISAQAYQESGLDQRKISSKGAIGIMQVLPTTAKDPNVNISNIHNIENNIHAGVKYMHFVKDRYFSNADMTDDDKIYFSLAAYNAGPARITRLQKLAKQHGYDPNKWFKNVEVIARRNIGTETVSYVANINRYYVIYNQLTKIQEVRESQNAWLSPMLPVLMAPVLDP
ncbi:lytic transglycosylase F [Vibrio sp. 10N.286.49.B3]|uniref:transglycosylase SLT domain-containing protein n=1 Tax=Vibrio sp. 10N.286.49.B3 TaxID=1880855 RepID=UPI000C85C753|nr:lytic transglycosylase F [Vibrio sp. 10N.286.49.B3]PMH39717.1 lytic transglycosylase F [Vibrio sp. 10N.286.49.B3]